VKPASQPVNLDDIPRLDAFEPHLGKAYAPTRRRLDPQRSAAPAAVATIAAPTGRK
jgi:hypothetical protein